jgi:hypothetical protein
MGNHSLSYVIPFRGNAFITNSTWTGAQVPTIVNCSMQIASDPNDIDFDMTACIQNITQTLGSPNWLHGLQTFHAAADALFLINQVQGAFTCTWPGSPGVGDRCLFPTYV